MVYSRPRLANVYHIMREATEYEERNAQYAEEHGEVKESEDLQFDNELTIQNVVWQYEN